MSTGEAQAGSRVQLSQLSQWGRAAFGAAGLPADAAAAVVASLDFAESRGVHSHGYVRLPIYVERILGGGIAAEAVSRTVADHGALVVVDAEAGAGAASATTATSLAVDRARQHGIGCVIVRNGNHFGAAAYYSQLMADAGFFGIAACNTDKAMCAPFGGKRALGTNPIAISVPVAETERPVLDMATSQVALGKVIIASQEHREIPLGWAVDAAGAPTTSPEAAIAGALLPAGGAKGFGLAFMVDALVALGGASTSAVAGEMYGDRSVPQSLGFVFIAIRGDAALEPSAYSSSIRGLADAVHASGPSIDGIPALVPGEPERASAASFDGTVELPPELLDELAAIGSTIGVAFQVERVGDAT